MNENKNTTEIFEDCVHSSKDSEGNTWKIGIKKTGKFPRPCAFVSINNIEIHLNGFSTKGAARQWWNALSGSMKKA